MVNSTRLNGSPIPKSWKDLTKPEYKGLNRLPQIRRAPSSATRRPSVNQRWSHMDNFDKAIAWFKERKKNEPDVPKQTSMRRVLSGEIPTCSTTTCNAFAPVQGQGERPRSVIPS